MKKIKGNDMKKAMPGRNSLKNMLKSALRTLETLEHTIKMAEEIVDRERKKGE